MLVIYSDKKQPKSEGVVLRGMNEYYGVIDKATEVFVEGNVKRITDAYKARGIKVLSENPLLPKLKPKAKD